MAVKNDHKYYIYRLVGEYEMLFCIYEDRDFLSVRPCLYLSTLVYYLNRYILRIQLFVCFYISGQIIILNLLTIICLLLYYSFLMTYNAFQSI